jgi:hypothetical protein
MAFFVLRDKNVRLCFIARSDKRVRSFHFTRNDRLRIVHIFFVTLKPSQFIRNYVVGLVFLWMIYLCHSLNFSGILEKPLLGEQMFSVQGQMQLELLLDIALRSESNEFLVFSNEGFFCRYQCLQS